MWVVKVRDSYGPSKQFRYYLNGAAYTNGAYTTVQKEAEHFETKEAAVAFRREWLKGYRAIRKAHGVPPSMETVIVRLKPKGPGLAKCPVCQRLSTPDAKPCVVKVSYRATDYFLNGELWGDSLQSRDGAKVFPNREEAEAYKDRWFSTAPADSYVRRDGGKVTVEEVQ